MIVAIKVLADEAIPKRDGKGTWRKLSGIEDAEVPLGQFIEFSPRADELPGSQVGKIVRIKVNTIQMFGANLSLKGAVVNGNGAK